jgi:hypothetical protein
VNFKSKSLLALVLAISITTAGCSAQWINIALQDLPVLTQMGAQHCHFGKCVRVWKAGQSRRRCRHSKHFSAGQP